MNIKTNIFLLIIIAFLFSPAAALENSNEYKQDIASYKDVQLLGSALSILQFVSMNSKNSKPFVYSALAAMASALDRYSFFVPPELFGIFSVGLKEKYVGIGIHIAQTDDNNLEIISTEPDGPAYRAGIRPKDIIIGIDGKPVNKMNIIDSIKLLISPGLPPGSKVTLSILHKGNKQPTDFVLARELIKPSIIEWKTPAKGIGYLRIKLFTKSTLADFKKSITEIEAKEGLLKGLIIDLRNNAGGDMESTIELLRLFINTGIIASLDSNYPQYKVKFKAENEQSYKWPLVVIVDEGSASAAELFSGSLQFHKRAKILGSKTFGKGTFQSLVPLSNDAGLYITLGKLYLPDGKSVEGTGLTPDIIIDKDADEEKIIRKSVEIINQNN